MGEIYTRLHSGIPFSEDEKRCAEAPMLTVGQLNTLEEALRNCLKSQTKEEFLKDLGPAITQIRKDMIGDVRVKHDAEFWWDQ